ncbi:MAG: CDP-alcohol phosphatidyltransferase family protein [Chloroflexota bacterium]|nr:CDP-alcohol phosphatidyltransferase family protein [Chloroflexota bacterium]
MEEFRQKIRFYTRKIYEDPISKVLIYFKFTPNAVTIIGLLITLLGSFFIFQGDFLYGGIVVGIGTLFDSIDGSMARLSNKASKFGDLLDSVIDRFSEGIIFIGIASYYIFNEFNDYAILFTIISLLCSQLISYIRAKCESLGIENKSGFFTRVERSIVIIVFLIISQPLIGLYILVIGTFLSSIWRLVSGLKNAKK